MILAGLRPVEVLRLPLSCWGDQQLNTLILLIEGMLIVMLVVCLMSLVPNRHSVVNARVGFDLWIDNIS